MPCAIQAQGYSRFGKGVTDVGFLPSTKLSGYLLCSAESAGIHRKRMQRHHSVVEAEKRGYADRKGKVP